VLEGAMFLQHRSNQGMPSMQIQGDASSTIIGTGLTPADTAHGPVSSSRTLKHTARNISIAMNLCLQVRVEQTGTLNSIMAAARALHARKAHTSAYAHSPSAQSSYKMPYHKA